MRRKKLALILTLSISLCIGISISYKAYRDFQQLEKRKVAWNSLEQAIGNEIISFKKETSILVKDLDMDWEISFNKDKSLPSASLVKVPIMAVCFCAVDEGLIDLNQRLILKSRHKVLGSGELKHRRSGREFSIEELIGLMISESDNTAANMLIELLGFDYLNDSFKRLGLRDTNISRRMMDFKSRRQGLENYTTCQDLAYLLDRIYNNKLINKSTSLKCLELLKKQKIKDRIPAKLPDEVMVAHKTGLEKGICHDAGVVFTDKGDFLICVLTKHKNKSSKSAKGFISQIAFLTYNYYQDF